MNERIKELAEQAALLGPSSRVGNAHEATEKFAELIVRECAKIADIADENKCEWIGGNVLTHFGVEE
jgi:6-phosphogluconate dehydrogenase